MANDNNKNNKNNIMDTNDENNINISNKQNVMDNDSQNTILITKIVLDFDDALFPSHRYREHEILKYHESSSLESVETGRDLFTSKEPNFIQLKKKIDLVIFKLMELYEISNFVILSTGDYKWIKSTLSYYNYLLSAYNIKIYSTQQWHQKHENDFNINCSLESKTFIMKMLLNKWKNEANIKYKNQNKNIKFRLISIGDSFFEFLSCYNIGFDYVNRIKLLEEPSVDQMIKLWNKILYLCQPKIYNSNIVFTNDNKFYYLNNHRMNLLNNICINRVKNNNNPNIYPSLLDIITHQNNEYYELKTDKNGKQYTNKLQILISPKSPTITPPITPPLAPIYYYQNYAQQQQIYYAQILQQQQQILQQQQIYQVPKYEYANYNNNITYNTYNNMNINNEIMTSNYQNT